MINNDRGRAIVRTALFALMVSCSDQKADSGSDSNGGSPGEQWSGGSSGNAPVGNGGAGAGSGTAGTSAGGTHAGGASPVGSSAGGVLTGGEPGTGPAAGGEGPTAAGGTSAGFGGSGGTAGAPSTCSTSDWAAGNQTIRLMHDGIERAYEIHVPPGYTGTTPVPLMLVIHGAHNTPGMARSWSQMDAVADDNGFIIAYPAGIDCWNSGFILPGCSAADDDVGFLTSVVADASSHACIDPKRVYATGISNGSMMAQTLGCEKADIFAAVGGVAGPVGSPCNPSRPITVTYFHGTADQTVSFSSAEPTVNSWVQKNGCTGSPVETYNQGSTVCQAYQECDDGVEVLFCAITGMGHCWPEDTRCIPQIGAGVDDFEASPMMWEFFERHSLP